MDALIASLISKQQSSAEMIGILILEELRMMRKDVNSGISKLQEKFERLETTCKVNATQNNIYEKEPSEDYELAIESVESIIPENNSISDDVDRRNSNSSQVCSSIDQLCENIRIKQEADKSDQPLLAATKQHEKTHNLLSDSLHRTRFPTKITHVMKRKEISTDLQQQTVNKIGINMQPSMSSNMDSNSISPLFLDKHRLNYACKICMKSHTSSHMLKRHYIEVHHHTNKNVCSFCGRACYNVTDLRVHIRTHTGEKPFKCTICEKAFADKSNYTRHCRMRKGLTCSECNKVVCTKLQLYQHKASHQS